METNGEEGSSLRNHGLQAGRGGMEWQGSTKTDRSVQHRRGRGLGLGHKTTVLLAGRCNDAGAVGFLCYVWHTGGRYLVVKLSGAAGWLWGCYC